MTGGLLISSTEEKKKNFLGLLQWQIEHKGTKIKHLCINCNKKEKIWGACAPQSSDDDWSQRFIFCLSSTWKGYFLAPSFAVKIWQKVWFSLFSRMNSRHFHCKLMCEGRLFWTPRMKVHLTIGINIAWITVNVVDIYWRFWLAQAKKGISCIAPNE